MAARHKLARGLVLLPFVLFSGCFTKQGIVMPWTLEHRAIDRKLDSLAIRIDGLQAAEEEMNRQTRAELGSQIAADSAQIGILSAKLDDYGTMLNRAALRTRPAPETVVAPPLADNAALLYDQAYTDYLRGRYEVARQGFLNYLKLYPTGDRNGNAQYWIGECLYDQALYPAAQVEFQKVLASYPESDKAPAALLKIGKCLEQLGEKAKAREEYRALIQKYPRSDEARLAQESLR